MEVYATDSTRALIEADVVEPLETSAGDRFHLVVGHEEIFLPPHEQVFALCKVLKSKAGRSRLFGEWPPGRKSSPMLHVYLFSGAPLGMSCLEGVFRADYFSFEARC